MVEKIFHKCSCGQGTFIELPGKISTVLLDNIINQLKDDEEFSVGDDEDHIYISANELFRRINDNL